MKIKWLLGLVWVYFTLPLQAQSDKLVDLFTGDFHYQIPAIAIPSSEGQAIALSLSYRGGVQMNQKASWVGLGWDLSIGEIKRVVKGVPDEWKGVTQKTYKYREENGSWVIDTYTSGDGNTTYDNIDETKYWGPLYYRDFVEGENNAMDMYVASPRVGKDFTYADYDDYVVTGPGVSGTMQTFLFDSGSLVHKDEREGHFYIDSPTEEYSMYYSTENGRLTPPAANSNERTCQAFTKEPQFRFKNEFGGVNVPFPYSRTTESLSETHQFDQSANPYTGQFDATTNKAISARNIIFFTNAQIKVNKNTLISNEGFVDYPKLAPIDRGHDDDIGAFQITNEVGMTFHYSLPVYMKEEHNITFEMEEFDIDNATTIIRNSKARAYVDSWKLTAITGPDFEDLAPLGEVGPEDKGYWVKYDYTLWEADFRWQSPYIGGHRFFGENAEAYKNLSARYKGLWFGIPFHQDYLDTESISYGVKEMYYLNYIQTTSHSAVFVKDIRLDEIGRTTGNATPQAALYLDRIVLIENADLNLFLNGPSLSDYRFEAGSQTDLIHSGTYQANFPQIQNKTLASIDLMQDYSLCKNYHGNVENNATTTSQSFNLASGANAFTVSYKELNTSGQANAENGKLTLNGIKTFGLKAQNGLPSYKFSYETNPNFSLNAKDFWGYYKSDYNSSQKQSPYTSSTSTAEVDAWSLSRIETPLGGFIDIEYEADEYEGVGYGTIPDRIFEGVFTETGTQLGHGIMRIEDNQFFDYLNNYAAQNVSSIVFSCPDICVYSTDYYYPPTQQQYAFITNTRVTRRAHGFANANINNIEVSNIDPNVIDNLELEPRCGLDGDFQGTANSPQYGKATASVNLTKVYGGGIRVKSISTWMSNSENQTVIYTTEYDYEDGIASIEPERFTPAYFNGRSKNSLLYNRHDFAPSVGYSKVSVKGLGTDNNYTDIYTEYDFINYDDGRYTGGAVKSYGDVDDRVESNYAVFQRIYDQTGEVPGNFTPTFEIRYIAQSQNISAFDRSTAGIGKIKSKKTFNALGEVLSEEINSYKDISYTGEVYHQRSHALLPIHYDPDYYEYNNSVNNINDLSNIDIESFDPFNSPGAKGHLTYINSNAFYNKRYVNQIIDTKTILSDESAYTIEYLNFDDITGLPTKIKTLDPGTAESQIQEITYAHELYPELGPKSLNTSNENLLQIKAREKITKDGELIAGSNTTFRNTFPVRSFNNGNYQTSIQTEEWQPHKTFIFNGQTDVNLWREQMEYTLFDERGTALEKKYLGDRYEAAIYGYDDRYLIAAVSDAKYTECAFSGAEDPIDATRFGGEVSRQALTILNTDSTYIHTGVKSILASQHQYAFQYKTTIDGLDANRKYVAKVWVYDNGNNDAQLHYYFNSNSSGDLNGSGSGGSSTITGGTVDVNTGRILTAGNWHLLSITISIPGYLAGSDELVIQARNTGSNAAYFDDFRFHPINSIMVSYVYEPWSFLPEYVLGPENIYDRTEYDAIGQRHRTYRETVDGEKVLTEQTFNYLRNQ